MLFASIPDPSLLRQLPPQVNGIEFRLDLFPALDFSRLRRLIASSSLPLLFTLRKTSQGGGFSKSEEERELLIERLLSLRPPFFDLEADMRPQFLQQLPQKYPQTRFILSAHHFEQRLPDLESIYRSMTRFEAHAYKLACLCPLASDALQLLLFAKGKPRLSAVCLGANAEFARVLSPVFGNELNYASVREGDKTAAGQLCVTELTEIYRYSNLNSQTALYGLIGDPVDKSQGHLYHNAVFEKRALNAVYVKMRVQEEELPTFLPLAKAAGFTGLSITTPLKEKILPHLNTLDKEAEQIGAVNTLLLTEGQWCGLNTDGKGALDALEKRGAMQGKKIALIGTGGVAKAIAFEAKKRGAFVEIFNRTTKTALEQLPSSYDLLINCTSHPLPISGQNISPSTLVMDVSYFLSETAFLLEAKKRGCQTLNGQEMFLNQAALQTEIWIGH